MITTNTTQPGNPVPGGPVTNAPAAGTPTNAPANAPSNAPGGNNGVTGITGNALLTFLGLGFYGIMKLM